MNINTIKTDVINDKPVYLRGNATKEVVVVKSPKKIGVFRFSIGRTKTHNEYKNGHAWVGDGYQKITGYYYDSNVDRYFHATIADHVYMDWGWRGKHNGWYDYDMWEAISPLVHNSIVDYIYNQEMIYNITPNQ